MDFISSKNIFLLIRDTLKLIDRRLMKHGSRTGYMLYKMLEIKGGYEKFELAELVMLATLHDIGAYKTENIDEMLQFESVTFLPHSIYGYLFMKYLSPMTEWSKILLYHHVDYEKISNLTYQYKDIAAYLHLAGRIDVYHHALGSKFDYKTFNRYVGTKFSEEAIQLFSQAQIKYNIFEQIDSDAYEQELDRLMDFIMFTNEEKRQYMEMLMYCLGFRSEYKVIDSVTSMCICKELAHKLYLEEQEELKLYYGALIHDIGMLAIPTDIINAERRLTSEETAIMRTHVDLSRKILTNRMDPEVVEIACSHHERINGRGYPKGLTGEQMNLAQKILQLADTMTGLLNKRPYREPLTKGQIFSILREEEQKGSFEPRIVNLLLIHYDDIIQEVQMRSKETLQLHKKLLMQFEQVHKKLYRLIHKTERRKEK